MFPQIYAGFVVDEKIEGEGHEKEILSGATLQFCCVRGPGSGQ
jgi:hypothetical protein